MSHLVRRTCNTWILVQAILLRRGSEHEGSEGLYSLKMNSHSGNESCSCTIAFEDRGDASNFCYLLESFFEGLGDFSADAVPLSTKVSLNFGVIIFVCAFISSLGPNSSNLHFKFIHFYLFSHTNFKGFVFHWNLTKLIMKGTFICFSFHAILRFSQKDVSLCIWGK